MRPTRSFSNALNGHNSRFTHSVEQLTHQQTRVGFLLLEHFSLLAFTQALDTLVTANLIQPETCVSTTFSLDGQSVISDLGIDISPAASLEKSLKLPLDLLVICGGLRTALVASADLSACLQGLARKGVALAGLWNGAWFLGQSGLLDGYRCAVHPEHRGAVAEIAHHSHVSTDSFVVDRDRLSAASPAGAFNMVLEWLGQRRGSALTDGVTAILAFEASRYRRTVPAPHTNISEPLREAISLMAANIEEPLSQDQIAEYVGRSKRQIGRLFQHQLGTTPVRYYLELRITESRRLLQYSDLPLLGVAVACGFVSASHFSKCYASFFGYSPSKEKRFACVKSMQREPS
ncbi:AraC family transcriptional regulator [Pseudomonas fluorescens]|uniref:GlxA family transcriptional regulator n=1 Tax=Pseudomonas TaxID=286 RepID=UPI0005DDE7FB|nr:MULTISPECIES: GlxA family transcriptional regulator [Pseudomonas]KJH88510.1 AraC family transcriptional regulator [Pseudomonas fluorescens]TFF51135.1 GlxA family transcriptional regulator [Pseudomonas putida]TFF53723.1 GlxA family transcriptional regulator [Pseudomonas putida]